MLDRDPHAGDLYVFRGKRGDLIKILWHDGVGMSLYAKRLERGRFIWPTPSRERGRSRRPSSATCWRASTGGTLSTPGVRRRQAEPPGGDREILSFHHFEVPGAIGIVLESGGDDHGHSRS